MAVETQEQTIETKVETTPTRSEVIANALATAEAAEVKDKSEDKKDDEKEEEVESKKVLTEDEILAQQGKDLILALKDPNRAGVVIDFLAKQAGYTKAEVKKADTEEVKDDILSVLQEALGDEFQYLSKQLAPALEKIIDKRVSKSNEDIRNEFKKQEENKIKDESERAIVRVSESFFGKGETIPDNVVAEMSKIMDQIEPTKGMSVDSYIELCFNSAIGKLNISKPDKSKEQRTNKNRNDAPSRLASERVPADEQIKRDSKPMSRSEAIKAAVAALEKET